MVSKPRTKSLAKSKVLEHFDDCSLIHQRLGEEKDGPPKVGRPTYIPTEQHYQIVRALCLFGAPHDYISAYIGITPKTLRKYYPELLADCKENKNYSVESSLFIQALRGNIDACKYWLDNHMRDKYNKSTNITSGEDNSAEFLGELAKVLNGSK